MAEGLSKLHGNVEFITKIGNDAVKHSFWFNFLFIYLAYRQSRAFTGLLSRVIA